MSKPAPERTQIRQDHIRRLAKRATKAAGIDIPSVKLIDEIARLVTAECEELRARHVAMLRKCVGRDVMREESPDVLFEKMAWILEHYWVDQYGDEQIPDEAGA